MCLFKFTFCFGCGAFKSNFLEMTNVVGIGSIGYLLYFLKKHSSFSHLSQRSSFEEDWLRSESLLHLCTDSNQGFVGIAGARIGRNSLMN